MNNAREVTEVLGAQHRTKVSTEDTDRYNLIISGTPKNKSSNKEIK